MKSHTRIAAGSLLRRAACVAGARSFPAWIDSAEDGFAPIAIPRVRDALVLRLVAGRRTGRDGRLTHASGAA